MMVEVTRGPLVESRHQVLAVVVDARGKVVVAWGDGEAVVYPRSAVKPLQAVPLIESGAADRFGLGHPELALACSSHSGEPAHIAVVTGWLARLGLSPAALECGAHPPLDAVAARALAAAGREPGPEHNNCSGKHTGFLGTAVHLGEATAGYIHPDHPVQRRVTRALAELTGCRADTPHRGVDGCGIPTYGMSLRALATGLARLADPSGLAPERAAALTRLRQAMSAHPELVGGSGRLCTAVMRVAPRLVLKGGAEGVYVAAWPERGLGVAVKAADGAGRAAEVALLAVLDGLGAFTAEDRTRLADRLAPPVRNVAGLVVGHLSARPGRG